MYDGLIKVLRDMSKMGMKYGMAVVKMREAADAIEELQGKARVLEKVADIWCAKAQTWIPVAKQLPPIDQEVIVLAYGNMMRIWNLHRLDHETADVCWECEDGTLDDVCVVTHWMPLPSAPTEPPKEET